MTQPFLNGVMIPSECVSSGLLTYDKAADIAGECEDGMECMKAHNLCELRVLAAIQMGLVDAAFKTSICAAYEASQDCQWGNIPSAFSLQVQDQWHSP